MGLLSDFFIASGSKVPKYNGGEKFAAEDKCQAKGISPLQGGQFLAVLRGKKYNVDMVSEFELVTPEEAEDWTMSIPDDMVQALANLKPKDVPALAGKFAKATAEELGWSAKDFVPLITDLSALARRAIEKKKKMYLWNCV